MFLHIYLFPIRDNLFGNQTAPGTYIQNTNVVSWTTWDDVTKIIFQNNLASVAIL